MDKQPPRIAVVGSLHLDILVNAPDRPRKGETLSGTHWELRAGGKGGNQAVQAARQGAEVYMIGRVGMDDFKPRVLSALQTAGVHTDYVMVDETGGTGMSVAIIDQQGDYGAIIVSGVNQHISAEDIRRAASILDQADCLLLQSEIPLMTVRQAAEYAHGRGVLVIYNAAPAYPIEPELFQFIDVLIVNEVEAEMLTGQPVSSLGQASKAVQRLGDWVNTALITLGGRGVYLCDMSAGLIHVPGYRVEVVDMHGAGDSFIGALAVRLTSGDSLVDAVQYANATGALVVTHTGPQSENITPNRVREFMETYGQPSK